MIKRIMRIKESNVDNNLKELHNSSYYTKGEFNIALLLILNIFKFLTPFSFKPFVSFSVQFQKVDAIHQATLFVSSCLCSAQL